MSFWNIQKIVISGKFNFGTLVALNRDILNGEAHEYNPNFRIIKYFNR